MFTTFQQRIPSSRRPDLQRLLKSWDVDNTDAPLTLLARSGGFLLTDRIELAEYRSDDDPLLSQLRFRVAGQKHYDDPAAEVLIGEPVRFRRERGNKSDPFAVEVLSGDKKLGYVPRQYVRLFVNRLAEGTEFSASTRSRLLVPGESARWVVEASRPASL